MSPGASAMQTLADNSGKSTEIMLVIFLISKKSFPLQGGSCSYCQVFKGVLQYHWDCAFEQKSSKEFNFFAGWAGYYAKDWDGHLRCQLTSWWKSDPCLVI